MGLLDFLNSDEGQLGMNMLAAGGPSTVRMSDGQRMAGAVAATNASRSAQSDAALKKAQLAEALQKTEVEKFGLQRLQDWQKLTMGDDTPTTSSAIARPAVGAPPASSVPTAQPQPVDTSGGLIGSLQGNAPPPGAQPAPPQQSQPAPAMASPQAGAPAPFRFGIPGIPDKNARAAASMLPPAEYIKTYLDKGGPQTDIGKLMIQAGIDPNSTLGKQMTQQAIAKSNYIAPTAARAGGSLVSADGTTTFFPIVPAGSTMGKDADGNPAIVPITGGAEALSREEAAKKGGVNTQTPTVRYVNGVPTSSTAEKDIGFAGVPTPQPGITTSLSGTPDDVYKLIDSIKNPQDRANMRDGYARQIANLGAGTGNSSAPSLPQQMPGIVSNANVANEASAKTMHDSYAKLQASNSAANSALDGINKMQGLAANKNPLLQSGPLMAGPMRTLQTSVSTDAAEYEKQRANLISMLSAQNGTNGTDAGRALTGDSVPDFGKPKDAIKDGLTTLKNQTMVQQLKSQFLTPSYQSGDSKTYTQKEGEFDRNISPSMMSLITMPAGQSRAMLLQSAAKDPAMRAKLEWAMQNGMLK